VSFYRSLFEKEKLRLDIMAQKEYIFMRLAFVSDMCMVDETVDAPTLTKTPPG
jgi:hypothetical protein